MRSAGHSRAVTWTAAHRLHNGVSKDEIVELFIHFEAYAGAGRDAKRQSSGRRRSSVESHLGRRRVRRSIASLSRQTTCNRSWSVTAPNPTQAGTTPREPRVWICSLETGWPEESRNPMATGWSWLSQGDRLHPRLMAVLLVCRTSSTVGVADRAGLTGRCDRRGGRHIRARGPITRSSGPSGRPRPSRGGSAPNPAVRGSCRWRSGCQSRQRRRGSRGTVAPPHP